MFSLLVVAGALLLAGCDLGTYEARRQEATQSLAQRARMAEMLGTAVTIPDRNNQSTGVSLSLPRAVGASIKAGGLPGVDFLGAMYEADASLGGGPMVLLGGTALAENPLERVVQTVEGVLRAGAPGAQVATGNAGITAAPNAMRISVTGPQMFLMRPDAAGTPVPQVAPGRTEAYVIPTAQHVVVLVFRAADGEAAAGFWEAVPISVNTIQIATLPAAPPM